MTVENQEGERKAARWWRGEAAPSPRGAGGLRAPLGARGDAQGGSAEVAMGLELARSKRRAIPSLRA